MKPVLPFLLWAAAASGSLAQTPQPQTIRQIAPEFFMVTGAGGNVTVWTADHGLVLVDDKSGGKANFDNLVAAIRSVSELPVMAVFNTHYHPDHVGNNDRFLEAHVMVIGQDALADQLGGTRQGSESAPASPNILFSKDFSLVLTRGRVDAHHFGPGHTSGDVIVYFPAAKILAAGDLLNGGTPTLDYAGGATIDGWLASLDQLLRLDFALAIPGHGDQPMRRADVEGFRNKMATFRDRVHAAVCAGAGETTLIERIKVDDLGWHWSATAWPAPRLHGLWEEANKTPCGRAG